MTVASGGYDLDSIDPVALGRLVDPDHILEYGYPYSTWARLREERPVARVEPKGTAPFWAVTRHEDFRFVSQNPELFRSGGRLTINVDDPSAEKAVEGFELLINMDPPRHGALRQIVSRSFTPRAIAALEPRTREIARDLLRRFGGGGSVRRGDFVKDVAAFLPLAVIAEFLDLPEADWDQLYTWSNMIAGSCDPEYAKGRTPKEVQLEAAGSFMAYFTEYIEKRRAQPTDDVVSQLLTAELDGRPLSNFELGYYLITFSAGHETTRNAIAGGLVAWMDHPEEFERLRADRSLLDSAVEEILRWTVPVIHFARSVSRDCEVGGQKIAAGETVVIFHPSANRDERVFDDPDRFQIDRSPNPHYTLGLGAHVCLGAPIARQEIRVLLEEMLDHMESCELTETPARFRHAIVTGYKTLPVEYRAKGASA